MFLFAFDAGGDDIKIGHVGGVGAEGDAAPVAATDGEAVALAEWWRLCLFAVGGADDGGCHCAVARFIVRPEAWRGDRGIFNRCVCCVVGLRTIFYRAGDDDKLLFEQGLGDGGSLGG